MWSLLFNFLGSGAFGGIIGGLFALFTKREERLSAKDKFAHEQCMAQLANQQQLAMASENRKTIEEQGKQVVAAEEAKAFTVSQEAAKDQWRWVRPFCMFYLLVVASVISWNIARIVGGLPSLDKTEIVELYKMTILEMFALTSLSVSWFFGARGSSIKHYNPKKTTT